MAYFAFTIGTAERRVPTDWLSAWTHHTREVWFPAHKRPVAVTPGSRGVLYGAGLARLIGIVETTSQAPEDNTTAAGADYERWPYRIQYRILVAVRAKAPAPRPAAVGISVRRIQRGPHTELTRDEYVRACAAIATAAGEMARALP
jgi:hypothetical protein